MYRCGIERIYSLDALTNENPSRQVEQTEERSTPHVDQKENVPPVGSDTVSALPFTCLPKGTRLIGQGKSVCAEKC